MGDPSTPRRRKKVLALGVSYASVEGQLKEQGHDLSALRNNDFDFASVETVIECVQRGILTEMDGRDLSRCLATEKHCNTDVYTVSQEKGAIYDQNKHLEANFNRRSFCRELKKHFLDAQFDQVILDYFWIPAGWNVQHWSRSFFEHTLVNLVKDQVLYVPSTPRKSLNERGIGVVYLPFCLHCFKEIVACRENLTKYYKISFLRQKDLKKVDLWKGTQNIPPRIMQGIFGKRLDQEELYCSFDRRDVAGAMDDPDISKHLLVDLARRLENFPDIRMIMLEPIVEYEENLTRVTRSKIQTEQAVTKEFVNFVGLTDASQVKRGFDTVSRAVIAKRAPATPKATKRAPRNPKPRSTPSIPKAGSRKRKQEQGTINSISQLNASAGPSESSKSKSKYKLRGQSPRSVVEDLEICEPQTIAPKALFDKESVPPKTICDEESVMMVARIR
jgi:hypothetical protein